MCRAYMYSSVCVGRHAWQSVSVWGDTRDRVCLRRSERRKQGLHLHLQRAHSSRGHTSGHTSTSARNAYSEWAHTHTKWAHTHTKWADTHTTHTY